MIKSNSKYCQHCKSTTNRLHKAGFNSGKQRYMCVFCETERARKYRSTPNGSQKMREAVYRSIAKNKHKQDARVAVLYALRRGELEKPEECSSCNESSVVEAHHTDYSKPLEVMWLCHPHHAEEHKRLSPGSNVVH